MHTVAPNRVNSTAVDRKLKVSRATAGKWQRGRRRPTRDGACSAVAVAMQDREQEIENFFGRSKTIYERAN
jgi:hypothetical protein